MRRLVPLLLLLAACASSKAAHRSTPIVDPVSSPATAPPSVVPSSAPPASAVPVTSAPTLVSSRPAPTHRSPASAKATGPASPAPLDQPCDPGSLVLTVTAAASGSNASFHATLTNAGRQTCALTEGASTPGIVVTGNGSTVWARGCEGSVSGHTGPTPCPQYARLQQLGPGASQSWTQDWDGTADGNPVKPAPTGAYTVTASAGGATGTAGFSLG
jgi:hypothetical protein